MNTIVTMMFALEISLGLGVNANVYDHFDAEQPGGLGIIEVEHDIKIDSGMDATLFYFHASELSDGLNGTIDDRDYFGVKWKFYK